MTRSIERFLCDSWASCSYIADGENGHEYVCAVFCTPSQMARLLYGAKYCGKVQLSEQGASTSQTDRQTDRRQTDGIATTIAKRNVETFS